MTEPRERRRNVVKCLLETLLVRDERCFTDSMVQHRLEAVMAEFAEGFTVDVIDLLLAVMEALSCGITAHPTHYTSMLCAIVERLRAPLWKACEVAQEGDADNICELYSGVSRLLCDPYHAHIASCACRTIDHILDNHTHNLWTADFRLKALRGDDFEQVVRHGTVVDSVAAALRQARCDQLYRQLLVLSCHLCERFAFVPARLIDGQVARTVVTRLCSADWLHVADSVHLLLQLLQPRPWTPLHDQLCDSTACTNVRAALRQALAAVRSEKSRQLRNDLIALAMASVEMSSPNSSVIIGLVRDLLQLCVLSELGSSTPPFSSLKLFPQAEDFEMKKQLVLLPCMLLRNRVTRSLVEEQNVLEALMSIACRNAGKRLSSRSRVEWTPQQQAQLLPLALTTLAHAAPVLAFQSLQINTGTRLLAVLSTLMERPPVQSEPLLALVTALACLAAGDPRLAEDLADQEAVRLVMTCARDTAPLCRQHIDIVSQCLRCASRVCENRGSGAALGRRGVQQLVELLERHGSDGGPPRAQLLLLRAVECVRAGVVGCPASENEFIRLNGVNKLLDHCWQQLKPSLLQLQLLSCLLQLCDSCSAAVHVLMKWRGAKGMCNGLELLAQLWRGVGEEDFSRDASGVVAEIADDQYEVELRRFFRADQLSETRCQTRPKIFSLWQHMHSAAAAELETLQRLLNVDDRVTLVEVQSFLELQQSFELCRIGVELQRAQMRPVQSDRRLQLQSRQALRKLLRQIRRLQLAALTKCAPQHDTDDTATFQDMLSQLVLDYRTPTDESQLLQEPAALIR